MKAEYNEVIDVLYLQFSEITPSGLSDAGQGIRVHTTSSGRLVKIEIGQASKKLDINSVRTWSFRFQNDPNSFDFERALEGPLVYCHFEFERLEEYISALTDHLPTVSDQYRLREERALNKNITGRVLGGLVARTPWRIGDRSRNSGFRSCNARVDMTGLAATWRGAPEDALHRGAV